MSGISSEHLCRFRLERRPSGTPAVAYDPVAKYWIVCSYELVRTVLRDPASFSARILIRDSYAICSPDTGDLLAPEHSLLGSDPPVHDRLRALLAPYLTRAAVSRYLPRARVKLEEQILIARQLGRCDVVTELCAPVVAVTLLQILGIDANDRPQVEGWLRIAGATNGGAKPESLFPVFNSMVAELWQAAKGCQRGRRAGLLCDLMDQYDAGELTDAQVLDIANSLIKGAAETTSLLVTNVLVNLHQNATPVGALSGPDALQAELQDALRHASPVQMTVRESTRDVVLGHILIPAGSRLLLLLGAANEDPELSGMGSHLAFGAGPHRCPGTEVALALASLTLSTLFARLPGFTLVPSESRRQTRPALCGFERLQIKVDEGAKGPGN